jgi:murein DD-endopeptidase MepM/ murein hydrolase activator NlpD
MTNPFAGYRVSDDWAAHRRRGSLGGVDFATPVGTPIYAPVAGSVRFHAGNGSGGYIISLSLADSPGYVMEFLHCSGFNGSNRSVKAGELLGYTGGARGAAGSGSSTGPHVHVHLVDPNGVREDVMPWFGNSAPSGIAVDGDFGSQTKRALQTALGVTADGDFGPNSTRALQSFLGVTADGSWGPATTRALQGFLGVPEDGSFGPQTVRALQASLNGGTFVKPVVLEPPKPEPVKPEPVKPEPVKPEPVKPEPVKPEPVKPEPVKPVKPVRPVPPKPTKPEEKPLAEKLEHQKNLAHKLQVNDLGSIISNSRTRKIVWAVWTVFGLLLAGVMGGYAAVQLVAPDWVVFAMGVSLALQPAFGSLAIANITPKKES